MDHVVTTVRRGRANFASTKVHTFRMRVATRQDLTSPRVIWLGSDEIWLSFNFGSHGRGAGERGHWNELSEFYLEREREKEREFSRREQSFRKQTCSRGPFALLLACPLLFRVIRTSSLCSAVFLFSLSLSLFFVGCRRENLFATIL